MVVLIRLLQIPSPLIYKSLIDDVLVAGEFGGLLWLVSCLVCLAITVHLLAFCLRLISSRVQQGMLQDLRMKLYSRLQTLDMHFYKEHSTGGLLSRLMSDASKVQSIVSREAFEILASLLQIAVVLFVLYELSSHLLLFSALAFPAIAALVYCFQSRLYKISKALQEKRERLSARIQENLSGLHLIQAMVLEKRMFSVTERTGEKLKEVAYRCDKTLARAVLFSSVLVEIPLDAFVWGYGGYLVLNSELSLGALLAFSQYLSMLQFPLSSLFRLNLTLHAARASLERLYEILDAEARAQSSSCDLPLDVTKGLVEFRGITVYYEGATSPTLSKLSLSLERGDVLGIVGPSGSGKTTLINALMRFVEISSGGIEIDGRDIREVSLSSLRGCIGYVGQ